MPIKKTAEDYHALADSREFEWLSPEIPLNTTTKTEWKCSKGHIFLSRYNSIRMGSGCPECAKYRPLMPERYHAIAENEGYRWIGENVPKSVHTLTIWECNKGHQWEATYNAIYAGGCCPECTSTVNSVLVSSQQVAIAKLVEGDLNAPIENYYVDILTDWQGVKIVIEYDGWYWHQGRQCEDMARILQLLNAGYRVLHIKGNKSLPDEDSIFGALDEMSNGGRWYIEIILDDWGA